MRARALAAAAVALLLAAAASTAAAAACPALEYQADIAAAAAAVTASPPDLGATRLRVDAALAIGGAAALQPVRADLQASPPSTDDAAQRLSAMAAALGYPPGATCNEDSTAAVSQLHSVYASPDFKRLDDLAQPNLVATILEFLGRLASGAADALGLVGGLAIVLVVMVLLALVSTRWLRRAAGRHAAVRADPLPLGDDPATERALSEAAAERGDYREAVRRAFRAILLEVAARASTRVDPAWTTHELLHRLEVAPQVVVALAAAAASFDVAWYSGAPVTRADWETARARCEDVRTGLRTGARAGS